jgi:S-adenosylmethionine decarboxylase
MDALGYHYLIELYQCDVEVLKDLKGIQKILNAAIKTAGATKVNEIFHQFSPQGVSGVIVIAESHFSIHTWPEYGYAAVDFFTCNPKLKVQDAYQQIVGDFHAKKASIMEIKRGVDKPSLESFK